MAQLNQSKLKTVVLSQREEVVAGPDADVAHAEREVVSGVRAEVAGVRTHLSWRTSVCGPFRFSTFHRRLRCLLQRLDRRWPADPAA
jgi:hypothetical protein